MKSNNGFTLLETLLTVGLIGILATIANVAYNAHIGKAQLAESTSMLNAEKSVVITNLMKKSECSPGGASYTVQGKYGSLVVSGMPVQDALTFANAQLKTGCVLTYTFATSGVSSLLKGKKVVTDVFNNGVLSKNTSTTADAKVLPKALTVLTEDPIPKKEIVNATDIYVAKDTVEIPPDLEPAGEYDYMQDVKYGDLYCYTKRTGYPHHTFCYIYSKDRKKVLGTINGMQYDGPYLMTYERVSAELVYLLATGQCPATSVSVSAIKNECTKAGYRNCNFIFGGSGSCQLKLQDPPAGKTLLETGWRENSGPNEGTNLYNFRISYFDAKHEKP